MTPESLIAPARLARRPVLATQSDGRLVDLVRAGHQPAFDAIVSRYRGPLLRYVQRFLPAERAEDAVQQSFMNAYEAMLREGSELQLRPWLYRIAHNTALNALRDRALRHCELPDGLDGVERPDEALERVQGLRDVLAAVKALPERQRDAIVLRELEGRSYDEIAAELRVSEGSVRQLLHRARNTLRAGATAVTPIGWLARMPWASSTEPLAARVAEICGAGAGGALVAKVCATALVTGAVVGGVAVTPPGEGAPKRDSGPDRVAANGAAERAGVSGGPGGGSALAGPGDLAGSEGEDQSGSGGGGRSGPGGGDGKADRSGSGGGGEGDNSGPGSGDDDAVDNSGPGSGSGSGSGSSGSGSSGDDDDGDSSGSGSSGSGSSGSGSSGSGGDSSGSGSSGSGSSGSGSSGSGSGSSGSGSSGSGSDSSGSGSDSSGSGSSGSGSDSDSSGSGSDSSGSGSGDESEVED